MDRRHQVFVSSTFLDLQAERAAVVSALLELEAIPAGMELFPAADDDAWSLIERVIDQSDYYLLVIGGKYGSIDPKTEISFTEKEYDFAIARKKPVLAFLHGKPGDIPFEKSEADPAIRDKLNAFREKVRAEKHVKFWSTADDLAGKVSRSYASFRQMYPAVGWVRGDMQTSSEVLGELNDLRKQLARAEESLAAARSGPPPGTEDLAQGGDGAPIIVTGETRVRIADEDYPRSYKSQFQVEPTWDELFAAVGPSLLDEAEQRRIRATVDAWLTQRFGNELRSGARQTVEEDEDVDGEVVGFSGTSLKLTEEDFGRLIVQLRALGLVARSERKRSVSDKGTYWTLTPYGDAHLTTLLAIRRDPAQTRGGNAGD
jgi:hypothetical protein